MLIAWKLGNTVVGLFPSLVVCAWWHPEDDTRERLTVFHVEYDEGKRKLVKAFGANTADRAEREELTGEILDELTRLDGSEFGPIYPRKMLRMP